MRHQNKGRKLNRTAAHRRALFRNLATELFRHGRIETTHPKALELRGYAERLITVAKKGLANEKLNVHARRNVFKDIRDNDVISKLFGEIAESFKSRPGGYTRVTKVRVRKGDNAELSIIELVGHEKQAGTDGSGA